MKILPVASLVLCVACAHAPTVSPILLRAGDATPQRPADGIMVGTTATHERPAGPGETEILGGLLVGRLPATASFLPATDVPWIPSPTQYSNFVLSRTRQTGTVLFNVRNELALVDARFQPSQRAVFTDHLTAPGEPARRVVAEDPRVHFFPAIRKMDRSEDPEIVMAAWVVLPDGFVAHVTFEVHGGDPTQAAHYVGEAAYILRSLRVGPRRIDLSAGPRQLGRGLSVQLPAGFLIQRDWQAQREDYAVKRATTLGAEDHLAMQFEVGHPVDSPSTTLPAQQGHLLDRSVTWYRDDGVQPGRAWLLTTVPLRTDVPSEDWVFFGVKATNELELRALWSFAQTLSTHRTATPPATALSPPKIARYPSGI